MSRSGLSSPDEFLVVTLTDFVDRWYHCPFYFTDWLGSFILCSRLDYTVSQKKPHWCSTL